MVSVLSLRPQLHLPLKSVALCLDCERCFELGSPVCPACGSETWTALARFLRPSQLVEKGAAPAPTAISRARS